MPALPLYPLAYRETEEEFSVRFTLTAENFVRPL